MPATALKTKIHPVAENKRYRFLVEWACEVTNQALTVKIRWYNYDKSSSSDVTILSENAQTADTWQVNTSTVVPPSSARWFQVIVAKPNVADKFSLARIELKEHDTSLARKSMSLNFFEDFLGGAQYTWTETDTAADGITIGTGDSTTHTFGQWSNTGIAKLTTGSGSGSAGVYQIASMFGGTPPTGAEFTCKVYADELNRRVWVGLFDSTTDPDVALANTVYGIGFRASNTGSAANWFGLCRNGTSETTVDLGITSGTTWRTLGWMKTSAGVQFLVRGRPVGSVVTTNIPGTTTSIGPTIGIATQTAAAKVFQCDFIGVEASQSRYL